MAIYALRTMDEIGGRQDTYMTVLGSRLAARPLPGGPPVYASGPGGGLHSFCLLPGRSAWYPGGTPQGKQETNDGTTDRSEGSTDPLFGQASLQTASENSRFYAGSVHMGAVPELTGQQRPSQLAVIAPSRLMLLPEMLHMLGAKVALAAYGCVRQQVSSEFSQLTD